VTVGDSAFGQVVRADLDRHAVPEDHADPEAAEPPAEVCVNIGVGIGLHEEGAAWVDFVYHAINCNQVVSRQECVSVSAAD
jgi:hypothetical protein